MTYQKYEVGGAPYSATANAKSSSPFAQTFGPMTGLMKNTVARFIRYRTFRAAEKELHALDDRMLRDIGINRSEIASSLLDAAHERRNGRRPPLG